MQEHVYFVKAEWDGEAEVWYVSQTDVPGLVAEADTSGDLLELLDSLIPEMLELNGADPVPEVPYSVMLDHLKTTRRVPA